MNVTHVHCICHILNLIVSDLFDNNQKFQEIILKLNEIRAHFIRSASDYDELNKLCKNKLSLKSFSKSRFNSCLNTLFSFIIKYDGFQQYNDKLISQDEWVYIFKYYLVIKNINDYIVFFSKTNEVKRDTVVFLIEELIKKFSELKNYLNYLSKFDIIENIIKIGTFFSLKNKKEEFPEFDIYDVFEDRVSTSLAPIKRVDDFWEILEDSLNKRLFIIKDDIENIVSLYLSPLYRKMFLNESQLNRIRSFWDRYLNKYDFDSEKIKDFCIPFIPFSNLFENQINNYIEKLENESEYLRYEKDESLETADIFWKRKENQIKYPRLFTFARKYLHVPLCSIEVERVFSTANNFINKTNTRTTPKLLVSKVWIKKIDSKK